MGIFEVTQDSRKGYHSLKRVERVQEIIESFHRSSSWDENSVIENLCMKLLLLLTGWQTTIIHRLLKVIKEVKRAHLNNKFSSIY
jgi:hypothetical protein